MFPSRSRSAQNLSFCSLEPPAPVAVLQRLSVRSAQMSRIQPPAFTAAKRAKQLERPSSRPSSRQQAHRFQAIDANSDAVELETFLATATAIQTLLGKTAVNEAWRSLRFTAVADDEAPTPQRAASARPSYRRPSARLTAEEQQRAAAEAARKQRFAKSSEESSRLLARELDTARMKQRGSLRKPGTTWPPEMAMCARLVSKAISNLPYAPPGVCGLG